MNTPSKPKNVGRNISRIREMRDMKQEALAQAIGVTQQTISALENSETVDEDKLQMIAEALGVSKEAIKNFSQEEVITYFNTFQNDSKGTFNNHCTFNPLDKLLEAHEENKKIYQQKEILYERLLQAEKDKVAYLEKLLNKE